MSSELTVLCGTVGSKWPEVWVHRLKAMVEEHCSVPYRFKCISDHPIDGVDTEQASPIKLAKYKPMGCWVKLDSFRREVSGDGPCIWLDLDITLIGDIASLQSRTLAGAQDGRTKEKYLNTSVMAWTPNKKTDRLYMTPAPVSRTGPWPKGDQEYIAKRHTRYEILKGCYSYKRHLDNGKLPLPEDTVVVYFHGDPTPADSGVLKHEWNRCTWEGLTIEDRRYEKNKPRGPAPQILTTRL